MRRLAEGGVEIRLLHAGTPSSAALRELKRDLPSGLTIRRCPRLHAKAVVIDCQRMYLGSANLTGAGLGAKADGRRNFEMGLWTESPALIDGVLEQFNALWEGHCCRSCKRKDVCPVPLEEPDLSAPVSPRTYGQRGHGPDRFPRRAFTAVVGTGPAVSAAPTGGTTAAPFNRRGSGGGVAVVSRSAEKTRGTNRQREQDDHPVEDQGDQGQDPRESPE